jgi:uncharacterized protein YycO
MKINKKTVQDFYKLPLPKEINLPKLEEQDDIVEIRGENLAVEYQTSNEETAKEVSRSKLRKIAKKLIIFFAAATVIAGIAGTVEEKVSSAIFKQPQQVQEISASKTETLQSTKQKTDTEEFMKIAKPGDILLGKYVQNDPFGVVEEIAFDSPWCHTAMYVGDGFVTHADTQGVVKQPLDEFFKDYKVTIYRPNYKDEKAIEKAIKFMESQIGKDYDSKFDLTSNKEHYCSELVYKAILESFIKEQRTQQEEYSYPKAAATLIKEIIKEKIYGDEYVDNYLKEYREKLKDNGYVMDQLPIEPLLGKKVLTPMTFRYSPLLNHIEVSDDANYYWSLKKDELKTPKHIKVLQHVFRTHKHIEQMAAQWGGASGVTASQINAE